MPLKRTLSETSESMEFATPIRSSTFSEDKLEDSLSKSSPEEEKTVDSPAKDKNSTKSSVDSCEALTVDVLFNILKAKDDIIHLKDEEKKFADIKIEKLESILDEKDTVIKKLMKQVEDLTKALVKGYKDARNGSVVQNGNGKEVNDENTRVTNEKTESEPSKMKNKSPKCKFEDQGKCKDGVNCKNTHPTETCQLFSKFGHCSNIKTCNFRHPRNLCYQWREAGNCKWGLKCRFQHPVNCLRRETFLGGSQAQNQFVKPHSVNSVQHMYRFQGISRDNSPRQAQLQQRGGAFRVQNQ